jgi:hypothetical protein
VSAATYLLFVLAALALALVLEIALLALWSRREAPNYWQS